MKWLALDFGLKRVGVAVSDVAGATAFARTTVHRTGREACFTQILELAQQEGAEALLVGLPVGLSGEDTLTTAQARNFAKSLQRRTTMPVYLMDETLSSHEAQQMLRQQGLKGEKLRARLDQEAAAFILQSFLRQAPEKWQKVCP